MAGTAAIDATVLFWLKGAGESCRNEGILEGIGRWSYDWGNACCLSEHVDQFQDEDAGECSTQVADTGEDMLAITYVVFFGGVDGNSEGRWCETYVARRVMYVPPMAGSEIRAWKAEMATNMTVFMNVERTCSPITVSMYHIGISGAVG